MKKILLGMALVTYSFMGLSQTPTQTELILNPSFEDGAIPTQKGQIDFADYWTDDVCTDINPGNFGADLLDRNSTNSNLKVPVNTFGALESFDGVGGSYVDNRYAHLFREKIPSSNSSVPDIIHKEVLKGTIGYPLDAGCYEFSFMAARANNYLVSSWSGAPLLPSTNSTQQIKVSLVSGDACSGLEILTTPIIVNAVNGDSQWNEYVASITIPSANSYDRIIFEFVEYSIAGTVTQHAYIDHVSLVKIDTDITISGSSVFCSGQGTFLSVPSSYDNYQWFSSASSQPISNTHWISVNSGATYTVEAWNDGELCHATNSIVVTESLPPSIVLPTTVGACNGNFSPLCAPLNTSVYNYTYAWYLNALGQFPSLESVDACYTPNQYGNYQLVVTNQYGCSSTHNFEVIEVSGPAISIPDLYYECGSKPPKRVGFPESLSDAVSYEWTYNDGTGAISLQSLNWYNVPFQGDGEYCVTVIWGGSNVSSIEGCPSTVCFDVMECCEPNPKFTSLEWDLVTESITVTNSASNTAFYSSEEYILYENCNNNGWVQVDQAIPPAGTFFTTVVFDNLTQGCLYQVTHNVKSDCMEESFSYTKPSGGLKISIYPNPAVVGSDITVKMTSKSETSTLEVYDVFSGELIFTRDLEYDKPIDIDYSVFQQNRSTGGVYNVRVFNSQESISERLIVR